MDLTRTPRRVAVVLASTAVLTIGVLGATLAIAGDDSTDRPPTASDRAQAERAALEETGGGTVSETELEQGGGYEVEVTRDDGTEVEVQLDADFTVLGTDTDGAEDDADERLVRESDRERAEQAALAEAGGGTVTGIELDDGSGYEVEVTRDGTEVEVQLDADFAVVGTDSDEADD